MIVGAHTVCQRERRGRASFSDTATVQTLASFVWRARQVRLFSADGTGKQEETAGDQNEEKSDGRAQRSVGILQTIGTTKREVSSESPQVRMMAKGFDEQVAWRSGNCRRGRLESAKQFTTDESVGPNAS